MQESYPGKIEHLLEDILHELRDSNDLVRALESRVQSVEFGLNIEHHLNMVEMTADMIRMNTDPA